MYTSPVATFCGRRFIDTAFGDRRHIYLNVEVGRLELLDVKREHIHDIRNRKGYDIVEEFTAQLT